MMTSMDTHNDKKLSQGSYECILPLHAYKIADQSEADDIYAENSLGNNYTVVCIY